MNNSKSREQWKKIYTNICFYLALNNELDLQVCKFWTEWQCLNQNTLPHYYTSAGLWKKQMFLKCPVQLLSEFSLNLFSALFMTQKVFVEPDTLSVFLSVCVTRELNAKSIHSPVCVSVCARVVSLFIVGTMLFSSFVHFFHFYHFPSFIRSISVNTGSNREQITGHYQNPYQNKTSNQFPACLLSDLPLRQCVCVCVFLTVRQLKWETLFVYSLRTDISQMRSL